MKKKVLPVIAVIGFIICVVFVILLGNILKKYTPTKERQNLKEYFNITAEDEVGIIMQNDKIDAKAKIIDKEIYLDYDTVKQYFNSGFYWDSTENKLLYALPNDVVTAQVGSKEYYVSKIKNEENYDIVKIDDQTVYVAIDFIKQYTNIDYQLFNDTYHVSIMYRWGDEDVAEIKKDDSIRYQAGVKSPILTDVNKSEQVTIIEELDDTWTKVRSDDGFIGYIKTKRLTNQHTVENKSDFVEPEYTSIKKDYGINMAWHQVFNTDANSYLLEQVADTKGLTTISPTWFKLADAKGNIESLADSSYVNYAHQLGIEVWALVSNIDSDVDINKLLSVTSTRQKLINQLVAEVIQHDIDGINVDFEDLPKESSDAYIEFIRELSVKCRNNGLVLSIDNYVPQPYNEYYNLQAQAEVADYVIIMGYDEHYSGSDEGSVASIGYVKDAVENSLESVPAEKLILGMPFYTRVWEETPVASDSSKEKKFELDSTAVGMEEAENLLKANAVTPKWNEECGQYYGEYQLDGKTYKIWLEEERSIEEKLKVVKKNELAGVSEWKLGFEKNSIWDTIIKYIN